MGGGLPSLTEGANTPQAHQRTPPAPPKRPRKRQQPRKTPAPLEAEAGRRPRRPRRPEPLPVRPACQPTPHPPSGYGGYESAHGGGRWNSHRGCRADTRRYFFNSPACGGCGSQHVGPWGMGVRYHHRGNTPGRLAEGLVQKSRPALGVWRRVQSAVLRALHRAWRRWAASYPEARGESRGSGWRVRAGFRLGRN